jgi:hypothetical protein
VAAAPAVSEPCSDKPAGASGITAVQAREHLLHASGQLLAVDSLFAFSPGHSLDHGPALQAHEELRPASWGDLTARLQDWLGKNLRVAEPFTRPEAGSTLHITHSWGGGVAQWVESFITAGMDNTAKSTNDNARAGRNFQLRSEGPQYGMGAGQRLSLYAGNELKAPIASWWLSPAIQSLTGGHSHYREVLAWVCRRHGIGRLIVSSLVGHSLDALRTGLPTVQVLHDFSGWPLLGIIRARLMCHAVATAAGHGTTSAPARFSDHDAAAWTGLADDWHEAVLQHG